MLDDWSELAIGQHNRAGKEGQGSARKDGRLTVFS